MIAVGEGVMRVAYADHPYLGQGKARYSAHHAQAAIWDEPEVHADLVTRLTDEFPDGWALSLSSPSLRTILPFCPDDVRVMAWVKPFCSFKPGVNPAYAWEPVIVRGGRKLGRKVPTVTDWIAANITLQHGLSGVKPESFCYWLFHVLGLRPGDEFCDLFPGSGAVSTAWLRYQSQLWMAS